jgi:hypothetical protein
MAVGGVELATEYASVAYQPIKCLYPSDREFAVYHFPFDGLSDGHGTAL